MCVVSRGLIKLTVLSHLILCLVTRSEILSDSSFPTGRLTSEDKSKGIPLFVLPLLIVLNVLLLLLLVGTITVKLDNYKELNATSM